jgi:hypothetical protein
MDLQLYFRVAWRFRLLVLSGFIIAVSLALLSFLRVDLQNGTLTYREQEQWTSYATLLLTEPGFPYGQASVPEGSSSSARFAELATIYSGLATSDEVRRLMRRDGPLHGAIVESAPVTVPGKDIILPLLTVSVVTSSPKLAISLTDRAAHAFQDYVAEEQRASGTPRSRRVVLELVRRPQGVTLLQGRSMTTPMVVFMTVMLAVFGLTFLLENLKPRIHPVRDEDLPHAQPQETRRSA